METQVKLPDLGSGVETADVVSVLVKVGQSVEIDQGIAELETEKAVAEVPCPQAGVVKQIHFKNGDKLKAGDLLLTLEVKDAPAAEAVQPAPAPAETPAPVEKEKPAKAATQPKTKQPQQSATVPQAAASQELLPTPGREIPAGPDVRRLARELGVDLSLVKGSGPGGRISRDDVQAFVRTQNQTPAGPLSLPDQAAASEPPITEGIDHDQWGKVRVEKLSAIRRTIARKMHESASLLAHVTNFDDADITDLEAFRQANKEKFSAGGVKLTLLSFVVRATAEALKANPTLNAALDLSGERIIYKQYVSIGIAVDTDRGLVVPVLRDAACLSIMEIARGLAEIARKARENRFDLADLRGGSFTISNLGAVGGTYSTPIINYPESAVLLTGRSRLLPAVVGKKITPRLMLPLSLSYDHRLIDGAQAARFLNDVKSHLESPTKLLLD